MVLTRIGYALPGSVVAIGMMSLFSLFGMNFYGGMALVALLMGYTLKFFFGGVRPSKQCFHEYREEARLVRSFSGENFAGGSAFGSFTFVETGFDQLLCSDHD